LFAVETILLAVIIAFSYTHNVIVLETCDSLDRYLKNGQEMSEIKKLIYGDYFMKTCFLDGDMLFDINLKEIVFTVNELENDINNIQKLENLYLTKPNVQVID